MSRTRFGVNPHSIVSLMSKNSLLEAGRKWPVWLNGSLFVYKLSGSGFKFSCSHLNLGETLLSYLVNSSLIKRATYEVSPLVLFVLRAHAFNKNKLPSGAI